MLDSNRSSGERWSQEVGGGEHWQVGKAGLLKFWIRWPGWPWYPPWLGLLHLAPDRSSSFCSDPYTTICTRQPERSFKTWEPSARRWCQAKGLMKQARERREEEEMEEGGKPGGRLVGNQFVILKIGQRKRRIQAFIAPSLCGIHGAIQPQMRGAAPYRSISAGEKRNFPKRKFQLWPPSGFTDLDTEHQGAANRGACWTPLWTRSQHSPGRETLRVAPPGSFVKLEVHVD